MAFAIAVSAVYAPVSPVQAVMSFVGTVVVSVASANFSVGDYVFVTVFNSANGIPLPQTTHQHGPIVMDTVMMRRTGTRATYTTSPSSRRTMSSSSM